MSSRTIGIFTCAVSTTFLASCGGDGSQPSNQSRELHVDRPPYASHLQLNQRIRFNGPIPTPDGGTEWELVPLPPEPGSGVPPHEWAMRPTRARNVGGPPNEFQFAVEVQGLGHSNPTPHNTMKLTILSEDPLEVQITGVVHDAGPLEDLTDRLRHGGDVHMTQ